MPDINETEGVARRELHIFYVLDTSGSMAGTPVATLNRAMEETIEALKKTAKSNADALLKIAVLEFNSGCRWVQPNGPEEVDDFIWEDLKAGGITDMGSALLELDNKLSRNEFLKSMTGAYLPVIIFMTDGYATDDYKKALEKIRTNKWFLRGTKIGFAIGDDPDVQMISSVVGNSEAVIKTDDLELFARLIKFASVTSSMLASTSHTPDTAASGADIVKDILAEEDAAPDVKVELDDSQYDAEKQSTDEPVEIPDPTWGDNDDWA